MDMRLMSEQQFDQGAIAALSGPMQRGVAHMVCGARIDIRAARQQCRSGLLAAEERSQVEWRPAIGAMRLEKRVVVVERREDFVNAASDGCQIDIQIRL